MRCRRPLICLAAVTSLLALSMRTALSAPQQTTGANHSDAAFDPLKQVTSGFPQSVKLNQNERIVEFCPDHETCDGLVVSPAISISTLKDVAYLYIYFFSGTLIFLTALSRVRLRCRYSLNPNTASVGVTPILRALDACCSTSVKRAR